MTTGECRVALLRPTFVALALLTSLVPTGFANAAGPYDPEVPYKTITTPHFYVSFPPGFGEIAVRTARIAEDAWSSMAERYRWSPKGRISVLLNDQSDLANGSATVVPNKVITLFVVAPTRISGLEEYDDWLAAVLIHEMAHIFHLDMAYGLTWLGRLALGKYVALNSYNPTWSTEGLAVYEETVSTGAGRGRSSFVDMVLRSAALEDRFPPIDQAYRGYPRWPFGNIAYFFGGRFHLWLAEKYGEDKLLDYHRYYAANPIPFITYLPAKLAFGESMESLWLAFEADVTAEAQRVQRQVLASKMAVSEPKRLTYHGGQSVGPRFTPDGQHIVFSTRSPVDGPRVRRIRVDGSDDEVLLNDTLSQAISFAPDGKAFYYQQTEINQRFYFHNNLFRYDIVEEETKKIELVDGDDPAFTASSGSLRLREPDVSPDGQRLVCVQSPYGANRLLLAEFDASGTKMKPKVLVPAEPDVQLAGPRFSPDGKRIAVSRFAGGRRDIVVYDLTGKLVTEVTRDRAQDTDPTWSPDGRWLVFSSDQTGIYNLYAFEPSSGELRQLTNLVTGAFQPAVSPDGGTVVFRGYSADGFDVFSMPFSPENAPLVDRALSAVSALSGVSTADRTVAVDDTARDWPPKQPDAPDLPPAAGFRQKPDLDDLPKAWSVDDYNPLLTLLPFQDNWNLFPSLGANEREVFGSLLHFGSDARGTHSYFVNATYGTLTNFFGGSVGYNLDVLEPTFSLVGAANAVTFVNTLFVETAPDAACPFGDRPIDVDDQRFCYGAEEGRYIERRLSARLSILLPLKQRHLLSVSYRFEVRDPLNELPDGTFRPALPRNGRFARVTLGYAYQNVRSFPFSISLERGPSFAVALSGLSKGLGSEYEQLLVTAEGRYYLDLPWTARGFRNHVLASRLGLGFGFGPDLAENFRLGGVAGSSALTTTTENFFGLRGFSTSALGGTAVISGSTEYRAPLFRIDRGIGTWPITFRVVHAAIFADYGRVFDEINGRSLGGFFDELAVGVGAEIRADILLTYSLPLTLRFGFAAPVVRPASLSSDFEELGLYFQLGSTF